MAMPKIKKSGILIAVVVLVTAFVYYRYTVKVFQTTKIEEALPTTNELVVNRTREVSAVATYDVPAADVTHHARFTVVLDAEGTINDVKLVEDPTNVASDKQVEFSQKLAVVIKGKKLSELSAVDRVGTSTLTTDAFNSVIDELKAKL